MKSKKLHYILVLLLAANCTYHPFVPPGEIICIESPATLGENKFSISGAYGGAGEMLSYSVTNSWVKLKYGLTNIIDLSISASGIFYEDNEKTVVDYKKYSLGGYVSSKVALVPGIASLCGGIGIGFSDLGNYANTDMGIVLGWENRFVVPLCQFDLFAGQPFNPQLHDLSYSSNGAGTHLYKPEQTFGLRINSGAKFPVSSWFGYGNKFNIYGVYGILLAKDLTESDNFISLGCGVECQF
jgi:hypothetical protein